LVVARVFGAGERIEFYRVPVVAVSSSHFKTNAQK
jgi:hypothetical protein